MSESRPLDVHRHSDHPELRAVITRISDEVAKHLSSGGGEGLSVSANGVPLPPIPPDHSRSRVKKIGRPGGSLSASNLAKIRDHVRRIVLDLILEQSGLDRLIGYSRRSERFKPSTSRYNKIHFAQRPLVRAVDALAALGYVDSVAGYRDRETMKLFSPSIKGTERLRATWSNLENPRKILGRDPLEETIILRDSDGEEVEYPDTEETDEMRGRLETLNQRLRQADIRLRVADSTIRTTDGFRGFDPSAKSLVRIFNLGKGETRPSFDRGGRFYRGWWQNIPSEFRPRIEINGKPCCEVDYSGLHFTLMYSELGLVAPTDPYLPVGISRELRPLAKLVANILINAEDQADGGRGLWKHFQDNYPQDIRRTEYEKAQGLIGPLLSLHGPLGSRFLYSGHGAKLQVLDSRIAELVMLRMPVPVLPVHDSFLVDHDYHGLLVTEMERAYRDIVGQGGAMNCSVKWDRAAPLQPIEDLSDWTTYLLADA